MAEQGDSPNSKTSKKRGKSYEEPHSGLPQLQENERVGSITKPRTLKRGSEIVGATPKNRSPSYNKQL